MNLSRFLEHWSIDENPFRAQEARHDRIFARLDIAPNSHPDFEKILGDLHRPSTSVVFGEKGSGKTAIRMQIAKRVSEHNDANPDAKVWLVPYDDLNPFLDWYCGRAGITGQSTAEQVTRVLSGFRLVDHLDAILHVAVPNLVDAVLGRLTEPPQALGEQPDRKLRSADLTDKRDLLLLQALYDRDGAGAERSRSLRRKIAAPRDWKRSLWRLLGFCGWILPLAALIRSLWTEDGMAWSNPWVWMLAVTLSGWVVVLLKFFLWEGWQLRHLATQLSRELRSPQRSKESLKACLALMRPEERDRSLLPLDDLEDHRYAMVARLRRVISLFGYTGVIVVLDRMDEPTLVNGDPERMRPIIWPMLRNKFLQQDQVGIKLLLPLELHGALFRETALFFQEARMDKQNLVEHLSWTGAMLYDLCNARLATCRIEGAAAITLSDLFDEDVNRQDLVDALDQMHQPRDAFKLIYECMMAHCANFTEEQARWRIPRLVLESVRQQQTNRLQMFQKGFRPA